MDGSRSSRRHRNIYSQEYRSTQNRVENRNFSQPMPGPSSSRDQSNNVERRLNRNTLDLEKHIASQEEQQLVGNVVEYILVEDSTKKPIMKRRIVKHVLGPHAKEFNKIMPKVKASLQKVFGYDLIELDNTKYILINRLINSQSHVKFSRSEKPQLVLLFIILTHIFMQDNSCTEDVLWDFLRHLGIISENNLNHPYFGNVKQLITEEFLAQKYLNKVVYESGEPPKYEYKWGPRAELELSPRVVMEFVSQAYNGRPLNSWPLQYKALTDKEKTTGTFKRRTTTQQNNVEI